MSGHKGNTGQEDMLKAYYKLVGEAHIDNILEELEDHAEGIKDTSVPASLDRWVESFILKEKKAEQRKKLLKKMKVFVSRAAMIAILLIGAMTIVTFTVEAVRVRVLNFFIEVNDTYTEIQIQVEDDQHDIPDVECEGYAYPVYLPEGYTFEDSHSVGSNVRSSFSNGVEEITLLQSPVGGNYQLDTEDAETIDVSIGEHEGYLILKENRVMVFWYDLQSTYTIISYDVDAEEIMMMAESIRRKD